MTRVFRVSEAVRVEELMVFYGLPRAFGAVVDTVWKISIAKNTV
ncbi:hypothetical protein ACFIQG_13115 [Comamonas odontotermitis]